MITEKNLEKRLNEYAKTLGVKSIKLASPNDKGRPDRMFLHNGRTLFMELKGTGKKATALQIKYIKTLNDLGFIAEVVDDFNTGKELINNIK